MPPIALAMLVMENLPALIRAGQNVIGLIEETNGVLKRAQAENRDPLPAEWDGLNTRIAGLREALHRPDPAA